MSNFTISQILMVFASFFDILGMQFKTRKLIFASFIISSIFISLHYYFLNQIIASLVTLLSVFRFMTCYFTTNKKFMYLFLILNLIIICTKVPRCVEEFMIKFYKI